MRIRFGRFTLDAPAREITRDGERVHLSPKAFDLLTLLVEKRPAVLDKPTLRQHLWPDTHVVDASLSNLVVEIRALAGGGEPPPVRTVHGVGYAFAGDAVPIAPSPGSGSVTHTAPCWVVWRNRPLALAPGDNLLGRDASCAVWIDESGVSRRHARVRVLDAAVVIEDLNSTNGTFVQGRRLAGATPLRDGDVLRLGPASVVFRTRAAIDAPTRRVRKRTRA